MSNPAPGKIICVGRNYAAHARELGNEIPERPLLFFKPISALIRSGEAIQLPIESNQVEHEAELGVVIGASLRHAGVDEARAAIAGYCCANDVTARDLQKTDGQWARAKGFDTFCPVGEVVPADSVDLESLVVRCRVNGEVRQDGRVADMIFTVPWLVSYISGIMTLMPGDLILTGTPEGVSRLKVGDKVEVEIPGVGSISNQVVEGRR